MSDTHIFAPDVFRSVVISSTALLVTMIVFGFYQAWRDRHDPPPPRLPLQASLLFVVGYMGALLTMAFGRYEHLGERLGNAGILSGFVVFVNLAAVAVLLYYGRDESTAGMVEIRQSGRGMVGHILRWKIFDNAFDNVQYGKSIGDPNAVHPGRRRGDRLQPSEIACEIGEAVIKEHPKRIKPVCEEEG